MFPSDQRSTASHTGARFEDTRWGVVLAAKAGDATQARSALEELCRVYWPPLYAYIRRDGYRPEEAQDLTQEFFAQFVAKDHLSHLEHQRGKFRSFLLTFLKHFLADQRARHSAQKRGGGRQFVMLDETTTEERYVLQAPAHLNPDQLFERRWAERILERALDRLAGEYAASGKTALFDTLKEIQPGEHGTNSYSMLGEILGMTENAIKSAVHRLRQRHRELLRDEIAQTVSSSAEVDEEIRHLLIVLGR